MRYTSRGSYEVQCKTCGMRYNPHDFASNKEHKDNHKDLIDIRRPRVMESLDPHAIILVEPGSRWWKHRQIYLRSLAFRNEMNIDNQLWYFGRTKRGSRYGGHHYTTYTENSHAKRGFLITNDYREIIGALVFEFRYDHHELRKQEPATYINGRWALDWVWIMPEWRHEGVLSYYWGYLRNLFEDFAITEPVNQAMRNFVYRHGDEHLLRL